MLTQLPLALDLSFQIESSLSNFTSKTSQQNKRMLSKLWGNFFFIILVIHSLLCMIELYYTYSLVAVVLCPFKTWNLMFACYLKYKCMSMKSDDFEIFIKNGRSIVDEAIELNKNRID